jgi:hypothetical protein
MGHRWYLVTLCGVATIFVASTVFLVALSPMPVLIAWMADDSFYYFQVARNIVLGNGPTFDGIHWTNGWHPLYLLLSTLVQAVGGAGSELAVRLQFILNAGLYAGGVSTLGLALYKRRGLFAGCAILILGFSDLGLIRPALSGIELPLVLCALAFLLHFELTRFDFKRLTHWLIRSMLLAFIVLSRLDLGLVLVPFFIWYSVELLVTTQLTLSLKMQRFAILVLPFASIMLVYLGVNLLLFQIPIPISGLVKREWAIQSFAGQTDSYLRYALYKFKILVLEQLIPIFRLTGVPLATQLIVLTVLGFGILTRARSIIRWASAWRLIKRIDREIIYLFLGWLGNIFLLLYYSFVQLDIREWYWGSLYLWTFLTWAIVVSSIYRFRSSKSLLTVNPKFALVCLDFICLLTPWVALSENFEFHQRNYNAFEEFYYEAAMWMRNNLPPGETAAAWDAGLIGYFSNLRVTNLDGLANSEDFIPYVAHTFDYDWRGAYNIREYLATNKPRFLILNSNVGLRDPEATRQIFCGVAQSCITRFLEYRKDTLTGKQRWLLILEMSFAPTQ